MKVNLAAQTFSSSVAAALQTCETDLELEEFEGAGATSRLCKVINDCFDLLNSKNKLNKNPGKCAITRTNLEEIKIRVNANFN